jgi:hypothetical protein
LHAELVVAHLSVLLLSCRNLAAPQLFRNGPQNGQQGIAQVAMGILSAVQAKSRQARNSSFGPRLITVRGKERGQGRATGGFNDRPPDSTGAMSGSILLDASGRRIKAAQKQAEGWSRSDGAQQVERASAGAPEMEGTLT